MILNIINNLHKEFATFLISIAIATILIVASNSWWQSSYNEKSMAEAKLNAAKQRYYTAINQKKLLKQFENRYNELTKGGIAGNEQRLNWVDNIEKITATNKIPYLKYKIEKRQEFNSNVLSQKYPGIQLFKSPMTLEMQLLHEGDLYTVINNLQQKAKGLFDVTSCAIIRNSSHAESLLDSQTDKNFSAKCELNWYTMQKKAAPSYNRRNI